MMRQLEAARDHGGIDCHLPTDLVRGQQLNASLVVAGVVSDAAAEPALVPRVLPQLSTDPGRRPVELFDAIMATWRWR